MDSLGSVGGRLGCVLEEHVTRRGVEVGDTVRGATQGIVGHKEINRQIV